MLSKRKLIKYRKEALQAKHDIRFNPTVIQEEELIRLKEQLNHLLELTQELIDQHLLGEK